jgi:hypothetical protein
MRIEAYLRILSDESTIRTIHRDTNLSDAAIGPLKSKKTSSSEENWWNWQTASAPMDIENLDNGLKDLLRKHRPIFPFIKRINASHGALRGRRRSHRPLYVS